MNCDGVRGLLSAYVDGELSAGELLRVEQHLRRCHWCADEVDALRQTIALVASLEEVEVPAVFHAQLHDRLVALGPPMSAGRTAVALKRNSRPNYRRWAVPAAAAAALVIGLSSYGSGLLGPQTPSAPVNNPIAANPNPVQPGTDVATVTGPTQGDLPVKADPLNPATPPGETGNGDQPTDPGTPPETAKDPVPTDTPPLPLGPTSNNPGGVYTATPSFLLNIPDPGTLEPQSHLIASVEATSVNPTDLVEALKEQLPGATINQVGETYQVSATVTADQFAQIARFIEDLTGAKAVLGSTELNSQMAVAYENLQRLDQEKQVEEAKLAKLTDETERAAALEYVADLTRRAKVFHEEFERLQDMAATGTISVTLKPSQAQ